MLSGCGKSTLGLLDHPWTRRYRAMSLQQAWARVSLDRPDLARKESVTIKENDVWFQDAPLLAAVAHIGFTQSPEVLERITGVKAGLTQLKMPVAELTQQTNVTVIGGTTPRVTQNPFWWFRTLDRKRAVGVSQNSVALYDADYGRFEQFLDRVRGMSKVIEETAGSGCFLTLVALRYLSGSPSDGTPSPYICNGLHGIPVGNLRTRHFHHEYSFWCDIENGGKLVVKLKTVHGDQLIPQEIRSAGLAVDPKFTLPKQTDAIQLDIYETVQKKEMKPLSVAEVEQTSVNMHNDIKAAFLASTTPGAHERWKRTLK
jgi:uncharacterized protein (TIGR04255 family)